VGMGDGETVRKAGGLVWCGVVSVLLVEGQMTNGENNRTSMQPVKNICRH
jgi:hypothetical protein